MSPVILRLYHADKNVQLQLDEATGWPKGLVLSTQAQGVRNLRFEDKTPFKEILECAGAQLDLVVIIDEGRPEGMWRDPLGALCDRLFPARRDAAAATSGYVLTRGGQALAYFRKALWDPLEDAEEITAYLARILPGLKAYERPKPKPAEPPPKPKKPKPKRTPIINPATGKFDEATVATQEIPSVIVSEDLTGEVPVQPPADSVDDDEPTATGATGPTPLEELTVDPYAVLGVRRGVPLDEAKKAYRALVLQYHPDKVASLAPEFRELAEKRTRELNAAYALIEKELG